MTKEESQFMTNREMARETYNMAKETYGLVSDLKGEISVMRSQQNADTKRIDKHEETVAEYKKFKWIATGATMGGWTGFVIWIKTQFGL